MSKKDAIKFMNNIILNDCYCQFCINSDTTRLECSKIGYNKNSRCKGFSFDKKGLKEFIIDFNDELHKSKNKELDK